MRSTRPHRSQHRLLVPLAAGALALWATGASAQEKPAAGQKPAEDAPKVSVGGTIFTDFTYYDAPTTTDSDGNTIHKNAFDVRRAYINIKGQISHLVGYRITPDIRRISGGTSIDDSLAFRLKYAFGELNIGDWTTKGSWIRIGLQQTPIIDYLEGIYRYRFQGETFTNKEHYLDSSDFGISAHINFPNNYGDVHFGVYNGEYYGHTEANNQKAFKIRASLRPIPKDKVLKGLRLTAFYSADKYVQSGPRNRFLGNLSFEHRYVRIGFEYLNASDQKSATGPEVKASGYSIWVTPRTKAGFEGLLRYDSLKPDKTVSARKKTTIVGVSYWFKAPAHHDASILADFENVKYDAALGKSEEKRFSVHCLFNF